jgi:hypothetical protein
MMKDSSKVISAKIVHGDEIFDVLPFMHKYE